ncbi:hypothetical protein GCM10025771_04280 [Niveibacterium umoris]|uniref:Uncharacterized protein n=1 Tax=Niveibacterium umoris TaxID=1193620 RepID=A0A840BT89_9RHOO|nr:hypothetical protein [Niveibacterium umoris]MBB4014026.1 hypothetical protein [Niveibacterium umoris]
MNVADRPPGLVTPGLVRSPWLRDLAIRRDRIPRDERADAPEIEEAFRVSFSDAVRAAAVPPPRDEVRVLDRRLRSYRDIAQL